MRPSWSLRPSQTPSPSTKPESNTETFASGAAHELAVDGDENVVVAGVANIFLAAGGGSVQGRVLPGKRSRRSNAAIPSREARAWLGRSVG